MMVIDLNNNSFIVYIMNFCSSDIVFKSLTSNYMPHVYWQIV